MHAVEAACKKRGRPRTHASTRVKRRWAVGAQRQAVGGGTGHRGRSGNEELDNAPVLDSCGLPSI
uniref:Uncharacterized protein n=1 Tax=Oryza barthii TaxID=65489 RepID=A0A0D3HMU7_9ORYZ